MGETKRMALAVTGSRHWTDAKALRRALDDVRPRPTVILHGGARGADVLAWSWALENDIHHAAVRPLDESDKSAYLRRNDVLVDLADFVIAFRAEGKSNGTDYTIRKAQRAGKLLAVITPSDEGTKE